jgi:hypothetical protein
MLALCFYDDPLGLIPNKAIGNRTQATSGYLGPHSFPQCDTILRVQKMREAVSADRNS